MSLYAGAMQSSMGFATLAAGVESAETVAMYNSTFQSVSSKIAASNARSAGERNISAVNRDRIMTNTRIRQKQDEAEAAARVSSALSGAKGASVEAGIQQSQVNEQWAMAASGKAADQQIEQLKAGIYGANMQLQARVEQPKSSLIGNLLNAASSFELGDLAISEALASKPAKADAGTLKI